MVRGKKGFFWGGGVFRRGFLAQMRNVPMNQVQFVALTVGLDYQSAATTNFGVVNLRV